MIEDLLRFQSFVSNHPIGSMDQRGAWKRWLRWQFGSRLLGCPVLMPWLDESCLVVERGMTGATGNLYCGLHEFADMALVLHYFSNASGSFVDVGANIGSYTILASKVCGASTIAIEPLPSTFERLKRNLAANGIGGSVEAHCAAAGSAAGTICFSSDRDTMNQVVDESYKGPAVTVPVNTLDNLLSGRRAGFWKVDVEGFEREVLKGASKSLNDPFLEIVLLEGNDDFISSTMQHSGFAMRNYNPFTRELIAPDADAATSNHVWVRESEDLCGRLRRAPKRIVYGVEF